jgi:hypothetical protein
MILQDAELVLPDPHNPTIVMGAFTRPTYLFYFAHCLSFSFIQAVRLFLVLLMFSDY